MLQFPGKVKQRSPLWDAMYSYHVMYKTSGPVVNCELTCNMVRDHNCRSASYLSGVKTTKVRYSVLEKQTVGVPSGM
ncbi:hypothetical protein J6590_095982 [Homalodisca vitripennis]|nr:hypothetical protein J6590_095982 [Homalodisca vitripennis]